MRNKFRGTCYRCGEEVEPYAGHFELVSKPQRTKWPQITERWITQHGHCAIKFRGSTLHHIYNPLGSIKYVGSEECQYLTVDKIYPVKLRGKELIHLIDDNGRALCLPLEGEQSYTNWFDEA